MKPLSIRLKNFIGIRNGLGLDEITIDLSSLSGLVALVGGNGAGKTTLLDNLTPFRIMPSKTKEGKYTPGAFSYYDEVTGIAEKEVAFEMGGVVYRSLLFIDPEKSKQEAYLYRKDGDMWTDLNKSGRTSTYDDMVESIAGSPRLFFNSIFRCQEAPRINTYRKGVIKDILAELLMLDNIKEKGKAAKAVVGVLGQLVDRFKAQDLLLVPQAGKVDQLGADLVIAAKALSTADEDLEKAVASENSAADAVTSINAELVQYQAQEQARTQKAAQADAFQKQLDAVCEKRLELYNRHYARYKSGREKRVRIGKILANANTIRGKQTEETTLSGELATVETELKAVMTRIEEAGKVAREAATVNGQLSPLQVKQGQNRTAHQAKISASKTEIARIEKAVKTLNGLTCNEDSQRICPAVKSTLEDKGRLGAARETLAALEAKTGDDPVLAAQIGDLEVKVAALQKKSDSKVDSARKNELVADQDRINKLLTEVRKVTRLIPELETAENNLREIETDLAAGLNEHLKDLEVSLAESDKIDQDLAGVHAALADLDIVLLSASEAEGRKKAAVEALDATKKSVEACRDAKTAATVSVASLKESFQNASLAKEQLAGIREKIDSANAEMVYWSTLEKAYGPDGVIALEIEDAGPNIAAAANDLLSSCFGAQFTIRLDTQDIKADGNTSEIFDITAIDNENGTVSSLSDKSGGQRTWLEDAVTKAIALVNVERSGKRYQTLFTDERDGALSQEAKREFFLMKRRALERGGFGTEFFISHSPEARDLADRRLVFKKGVGVVVE